MAFKVVMPKLGMTMESGKLIEWKKREGDRVEQGEIILIIETEKISYEVESPASGLLRIIVQQEYEVPLGELIALIAPDQGEYDKLLSDNQVAGLGAPTIGPEEKPVAEPVGTGTASATPSEKIRITPAARKLAKERGIDIRLISGTGPGARITKEDVLSFAAHPPAKAPDSVKTVKKFKITPVARRLAAEKSIELSLVKDSGPGGRITRKDIESFEIGSTAKSGEVAGTKEASPTVSREPESFGTVKRTQLRRIVADKMLHATHEAAQAVHSNDVDATAVVEYREKLLPHGEREAGVRITITDIIMKIAACALKEHPIINSRYTDDEDILYKNVNMGMAMSIREGELVVPVFREIDQKSIFDIAVQRGDYMQRGREGKLTLDEIKGSTFTVTSLGMFGLERFVAIINQPENAILAVGAILEKPWVHEGQISIRKVMNTTLSYDHRTIYGAEAAKFMATLKMYIETPSLVLEEKPSN